MGSRFRLIEAAGVSHCTGYILSQDDLQPLLDFVGHAAAKWREIGGALGFSTDVLDTIAAKPENMSRGPVACFTDLLSRWLKWAPPNHDLPTLETLAKALRAGTVGEERMAYDLTQGFQCKFYSSFCKPVLFTYPTAAGTPSNVVKSPPKETSQPQLSPGRF